MCRMRATKGSNAYVSQLKCEVCGFKKSERADHTRCMSSAACPHERLTKLKSTAKFDRMHCLDCNTTIDSVARDEHAEAERLGKEVQRDSNKVKTTVSKVAKGVVMTPAATSRVLQLFGQQVAKFMEEKAGGDILASEHYCPSLCCPCFTCRRGSRRQHQPPDKPSGGVEPKKA